MTAPQTVADVQHTPGPWLLSPLGGVVYVLDENGFSNRFSAHIQGGYVRWGGTRHWKDSTRTSDAEVMANVRLIVAAPEMKEALEQIRKYVAEAFEGTIAPPHALDAIDHLASAALRAAATSARQGETK